LLSYGKAFRDQLDLFGEVPPSWSVMS